MSDWIQSQDFNRVTIGVDSPESLGLDLANAALSPASAAWPAANRCIFVPFVVYTPLIAVKMGIRNGSTASGNFDIGIVDDQQSRLVSAGSTAQAGTTAVQSIDITDTALVPGVYYMALCMDGTTGTTFAWATPLGEARASGVLSQSVGAVAIPNPVAFAAAQDAYIPSMFLTTRTLV